MVSIGCAKYAMGAGLLGMHGQTGKFENARRVEEEGKRETFRRPRRQHGTTLALR